MALEDLTPAVRIEAILDGADIDPANRLEYFLKQAANEVPKPATTDAGKIPVVNSDGVYSLSNTAFVPIKFFDMELADDYSLVTAPSESISDIATFCNNGGLGYIRFHLTGKTTFRNIPIFRYSVGAGSLTNFFAALTNFHGSTGAIESFIISARADTNSYTITHLTGNVTV